MIAAVVWAFKLKRKRFNEKLKSAAFNPAWILILQKNMALYNKLPDTLRHKLHGLINVFLHEKNFSGYNGLKISDEIKVTIAGQACLLMLNRDEALYPTLHNILVYPAAFKSMQTTSDGTVQTIQESVRLGESWHRGHVVLSWQHAKQGGVVDGDGHNVVYHEFAHQLDNLDGAIDGTPELDSAANYTTWVKVFGHEFGQLRELVAANKSTLIDAYGAESEGEFFAVVTELFFEQPEKFEKKHPGLFKELIKFYHLNPLEWIH
ncbi:MAG: zinc-dependent peptidase [Gammaproteobacteria bacterium]|nr:zinc-dependent peptidase [Gammaproteobacteria bacterium]